MVLAIFSYMTGTRTWGKCIGKYSSTMEHSWVIYCIVTIHGLSSYSYHFYKSTIHVFTITGIMLTFGKHTKTIEMADNDS